MQASVDAAYDPWREAIAPKTPNQFASVITEAS
jgi:nitrite reductase [NAD(P)H] large subunit